jgi:hypothetical protein
MFVAMFFSNIFAHVYFSDGLFKSFDMFCSFKFIYPMEYFVNVCCFILYKLSIL